MYRVLVTGAGGFIGRVLCARMLSKNWFVRGIVREAFPPVNLETGVDFFYAELIGPDNEWIRALEDIDVVVHLAARVHVMDDHEKDPLAEFRKVNVEVTSRLAQKAALNKVRRFIYMSSVKVNGEERDLPYIEMDIPAPLDPYGISKWEAEQELHKIAETTSMEVVILRPPLVYGAGVKANFLRLLETVTRGVPLPLANIDNRRSLIYLENLVDAVITCITHPKAAGQTYLVSDGEDVSTSELIRRIGFALDRPIRMFPFPTFLIRLTGRILGKSAEVERLISSLTVDCSKIQRQLSWEPSFSMRQGLRETAKWYLKK